MNFRFGEPRSQTKPTAYSDIAALPQFAMVGLVNAWLAYGAAVSYFAPRTMIPASVSRTTCSNMSGSCSCGGFERSPFGSVLAETWKGSTRSTASMWRRMFAEKRGSTSLSTSWPSNSDHISPTVSSPTRVTTPPISSSTVSVARRLSHQSAWVRGSLFATACNSPPSRYASAAWVAASCCMS